MAELRCTPELTDEVRARLLEGDTLAPLGLQPDMPCRARLYAWMKQRPAVAEAVVAA